MGYRIKRILIVLRFAVNLLSLQTLKKLERSKDDLKLENVTIHGFNQNSQLFIGSIRLTLVLGDLQTHVKLYIIHADTSYKALLGRPWLQKN